MKNNKLCLHTITFVRTHLFDINNRTEKNYISATCTKCYKRFEDWEEIIIALESVYSRNITNQFMQIYMHEEFRNTLINDLVRCGVRFPNKVIINYNYDKKKSKAWK